MSENTDKPSKDSGFESGLDYGAFAEDAPDFPEDREAPAPERPDSETPSVPDNSAPAKPVSDKPASGQSAAEEPVPGKPVAETPVRETPAPAQGATSAPGGDDQPTTVVPRTEPRDQGSAEGASPASAAAAGAATAPIPPTFSPQGEQPAAKESPEPPAAARPEEPVDKKEAKKAEKRARRRRKDADGEAAEDSAATRDLSAAPAGAAGDRFVPYADADGESITDQDLDEEVAKSKRGISRTWTVLIAIFFPVLVIVAAVRAVASPVFLWAVYNRPGFPADDVFSTGDRILYGSYGMDYLFNAANSRYLGELQVDGEALFTQEEVSHMTDVKFLMTGAMLAGVILLVLVVLFALMLRSWRPGGLARGVFAGSWVTLALIVGVGVLAFLDWDGFFTGFHEVFFEEGTWTFAADSTLIRLYPGQFWIDAGIAALVVIVVITILCLILTWPTKRRRERRAARLKEVHARRREKLIEELTKESAQ